MNNNQILSKNELSTITGGKNGLTQAQLLKIIDWFVNPVHPIPAPHF